MHFRLVGGAEDAFPIGRRSQRCISAWSEGPGCIPDWSEETKMHFRMVGGAEIISGWSERPKCIPGWPEIIDTTLSVSDRRYYP